MLSGIYLLPHSQFQWRDHANEYPWVNELLTKVTYFHSKEPFPGLYHNPKIWPEISRGLGILDQTEGTSQLESTFGACQ